MLKCRVCSTKGATLGCHVRTCRSSFHLPCARFARCGLQVGRLHAGQQARLPTARTLTPWTPWTDVGKEACLGIAGRGGVWQPWLDPRGRGSSAVESVQELVHRLRVNGRVGVSREWWKREAMVVQLV
jgi:PHD-like zinc-binding domain